MEYVNKHMYIICGIYAILPVSQKNYIYLFILLLFTFIPKYTKAHL